MVFSQARGGPYPSSNVGALPKGFSYIDAMEQHPTYWQFMSWLMGIDN